jgi:hypothetical protein
MADDDEHVAPQDPTLDNSPKAASRAEAEADAALEAFGHEGCLWNDKKYSDGAVVCDNHTRYECWNGRWVEIGLC